MGTPIAAGKIRRASRDVVQPLPVTRDDASLVEALRAGEAWARAALFDRYSPLVQRTLAAVLGHERHADMTDLLHDAFVQALASLRHLRDAAALPAWMQTIAARTAYRTIRLRRARRWLLFWEPERVPEIEIEGVEPEVLEAYRRAYAILDRLPAPERMAFVLRHVEGMKLEQVAEVCEVSLATIKRRLAAADERFLEHARQEPALAPWLERGNRWTT